MKLEHEGKTYEFDWYLQGGELAFIESIRLEGGDWLDRDEAEKAGIPVEDIEDAIQGTSEFGIAVGEFFAERAERAYDESRGH